MRLFYGRIAIGLSILVMTACQTIPDGAPEIYSEALQEVEAAEDEDADRVMPVTVKNSRAEFDTGIDLYKDSLDIEGPEADENRKKGAASAERAKTMAATARAANNRVALWDQDSAEASDHLAALSALDNGAMVVTEDALQSKAQELAQSMTTVSVLPAPTSLAFFRTDSSELTARDEERLNKLAEFLKSQDDVQLTLTGYADPRGPDAWNSELAQARADRVAEFLISKGVPGDRIARVAGGVASDAAGSQAQNQLGRRVDMEMSLLGH